MKHKLNILLILFGSLINLQAQKNEKLKALNSYVNFTNESIHGILTVHRLLENFNQEVNKYVDLPGYKINNISNSDLPGNIFRDEDHWFYSVTPYEWYEKIKAEKSILGEENTKKILPIAEDMFKTENHINKIRFDIADFIKKSDLTQKSSLDSVYILMEKAVDIIDLFYALELNLEDALDQISATIIVGEKAENPYIELYKISRDLVTTIRVSDQSNVKSKIQELEKNLISAKTYYASNQNDKSKLTANKVIMLNEGILKITKELIYAPVLAEEYKLYGDYYYYYNVRLVEKLNRYGNGFVPFLNNLIDIEALPYLHRMELPHYFKVIYPKRVDKQIETIAASVSDIKTLPTKLAGREVKPVAKEMIITNTESLEIELYDFKIQDGDIVSINFNGDWIYEKLSLETKPKKLILELNESGRNYIILHAVNVGRRPPNTIGLNYTYKGQKKTIVMQSDLDTSELVEIKLEK